MLNWVSFLNMIFLVLTLLSAIFITPFEAQLQCPADKEESWTYRGLKGPYFWGGEFPECNGQNQSPIEIDSVDVETDTNLAQLALVNYESVVTSATIENNGHTVEIVPTDGVSRTIEVNGEEYGLNQLHFHWGFTYSEGSEHIIDGVQYAMEMHLVHLSHDGKIAVVGIFFQEQQEDNQDLQPIVEQLQNVEYKENSSTLTSNLDLNSLLPANPTSFYRYAGSLTTPGCAEGVTWNVVSQPLGVGKNQMKEFRKLFSATKDKATIGCTMAPNYRPPQDLNGRTVYASQ